MFKAYSKRLLSPYTGQVQIVESSRARAMSLDGNNWEIQFQLTHESGVSSRREKDSFGKAAKKNYIRIANLKGADIELIQLPSFLDAGEIDERITELTDFLADVELPLPAADEYEYWLLDEKDESPHALIFSCVMAEEMALYPQRPEWTALPASMMEVKRLPEEESFLPPVNCRFEQLVNERAGRHPKARWFRRREAETDTFPSCVVSEVWKEEADHDLCQRYILRQAPRLLMLHGLEHDNRLRLEQAAKAHALEVERFCGIYPEVADEKLMNAIRVEAQLRRASQST